MAQPKFDLELARKREDASANRVNELAEKLNSIQAREVKTDDEKAQLAAELKSLEFDLNREQANLAGIRASIMANATVIPVADKKDIKGATAMMRECISKGEPFKLEIKKGGLARSFEGNTSGWANPSATTNPDTIYTEDVVKPLYEASILSAIGVPQRTGLKGNHVYPIVEAFDIALENEAVEIGDSKIETSKLWAKPNRASVAIPITKEALLETENLLQTIFTTYAPAAAAELENKIIVSTSKVNNATTIEGPFVTMGTKGTAKTYTGSYPTLKELTALKTAVLKKKVQGEFMAYIMTEDMKGELEDTPRWEGSDKAIIEDGKIKGIPVVTSAYCPADTVEFGAFRYYPLDIFGGFDVLIDPYTKSRFGAIDCQMEFHLAGTKLRDEAFALLTKKTTTASN